MPEFVLLGDQLLAPVPGGTGRYTRQLGAALARTAPPGWTVTVAVTRHRDVRAAAIPGTRLKVLGWPRRALIAAWERGVPWWPGGDSVHAPTPFAPARARRGKGLVVTVHDTVPYTHPQTLTRRGAAWHRRAIARAVTAADAIVTPTAAVAAELSQYVGACAATPIPHGVSAAVTATVDADRAEQVRRRLGLPQRYVLAVGTIEPRKGIDVLISALAQPLMPAVPLVLVGPKGWGAVDPLALAAEAGVVEPLVLGTLSDAELSVVLRGAAALVAPSLAEGFGLPVLEAMAVGVPVVHTDVPALLEVAGGTGVVARRGDAGALAAALRSVLTDTADLPTRIAAARTRAQGFTWDAAAQRVWQLHLRIRADKASG